MRKICTKKRVENCAKCQIHRKNQQTRGLQAGQPHRRQSAAHHRQTAAPAGRPAHPQAGQPHPQADQHTTGRPPHHRQTSTPQADQHTTGRPAHHRQTSTPQASHRHRTDRQHQTASERIMPGAPSRRAHPGAIKTAPAEAQVL